MSISPVASRSRSHARLRPRPTSSGPWALVALVAGLLLAVPGQAQQVPHPADVFGFEPGADYHLADYDQLTEYYRALAEASDRVHLEEIGTTTRGLPMHLLFISSAENLAQLDRWQEISRRLGLARDLDDAEARALASEGKAIVWIDSGLHSTEVAHAQHAPLLAHHMATDEAEETRRMRENTILLLMPVMNPDGHEIVVDWYRGNLDTPFETTGPPEIYHEYVGHDNNRDWFMITQDETKHVSRVIYEEWFPQIVFNHHQTGPFPARITLPPFAEPVNPHIPPQVVRGVNLVGSYMSDRLDAEGMPGALSYTQYDMWWNGGMRLAPFFHNMLGILVEVQHNSATPRYVDPDDLPEEFGTRGRVISAREPSIFYPNPWPGGWLTLRESVDYHFTTSLAVLDIAALRPEQFLYNFYQMGRQQIEAGEEGGPFAYLVPPEQWDRYEAVEMLNVFRRGGVEVHEATAPFQAGGREFPAGTHVLYAGQAFRAHLMDLMEPQSYPERRLFPGGPPEPPYDLAGWTLPIQMGVDVVRIDEPFQASTREVTDRVALSPGSVQGEGTFGWAFTPRSNASAIAANRLLASGENLSRATASWSAGGMTHDAGTWVVEAGEETPDRVQALARELGLDFSPLASTPGVELRPVPQPRIGVYRPWMDNIPEGWVRWILDTYEFAYETLRNEDIQAGDLADFDVILLPAQAPGNLLDGHAEGAMPSGYVGGLGRDGTDALRRYVEEGGTVMALDGAGDVLMDQWELPVESTVRDVPSEDFFIPGSLLRIRVNPDDPFTWGMPEETSGTFVTRRGSQSRAFRTVGSPFDVEPVVWWGPEGSVLLSGWALGEDEHLADRPAAVRIPMGQGELFLLGLRAGFRGQPRATFKLLFNPLYAAAMGGGTASSNHGNGESARVDEDPRVILITGSTGGLGREVALELGAQGHHVIVHGRNRERGLEVVQAIQERGGSASLHIADLASLDEVRGLAAAIKEEYDRLDVLVNNAGIWLEADDGRILNDEGVELHFQVNYLAHFLLTEELLPLLEASTPARIIHVSSVAQRPIDFDDVMMEAGYSDGRGYAQSKLAQILHTFDLAEALEGSGVLAVALHPATMMDTGMVLDRGAQPRASVDEGAEALLRLILADDVENGRYYRGLEPAPAHDQAHDPEARQRLRALSLQLTGLAH